MKRKAISSILLTALCLLGSVARASTWYVNGMSGSDSNNCVSAHNACKTIGHAISLASSGDSIIVAAATYTENLTIGKNLNILGSGAPTTIIDGGGGGTVVNISSGNVTVSGVTIRHGHAATRGGGVQNGGVLTLRWTTVSSNIAEGFCRNYCAAVGGGIFNAGTLTINNSTISGNVAETISCVTYCVPAGGGIFNDGTLTINNSTIARNTAKHGGAIYVNQGKVTMSNATVSGNVGFTSIDVNQGAATLQNSIVANNSGGNCSGTMTSNGYNLSSDGRSNFNGPGDLNNTNPMLGPLQNNGGPTQTMALPSGSPAVDAGNPSGCTDSSGHLLKTDQRGMQRHDTEDTGGCDMGAYERQSD